ERGGGRGDRRCRAPARDDRSVGVRRDYEAYRAARRRSGFVLSGDPSDGAGRAAGIFGATQNHSQRRSFFRRPRARDHHCTRRDACDIVAMARTARRKYVPEEIEVDTDKLHEEIHEELESEGGWLLKAIALTTELFEALAALRG